MEFSALINITVNNCGQIQNYDYYLKERGTVGPTFKLFKASFLY